MYLQYENNIIFTLHKLFLYLCICSHDNISAISLSSATHITYLPVCYQEFKIVISIVQLLLCKFIEFCRFCMKYTIHYCVQTILYCIYYTVIKTDSIVPFHKISDFN